MLDPVFVDENVAFSPMPEAGEEPVLHEQFDLVIAVVEQYEFSYNPRLLGGKLLHLPVPDFAWPSLAQLHHAVSEAIRVAGSGGRVLVHCRGGCGRSATVAGAYLIARYHASAKRVAAHLRGLRGCALEHPGQVGVLEAYELLQGLPPEQLDRVVGLGDAARLAAMLAYQLVSAGLLGSGAAPRLAAEASEGRGPLGRTVAEIGPDAGRVARIEAGLEDGRLLVNVTLTGHSDFVESMLPRLLREALRGMLGPLAPRSVELWDVVYW